MKPGSKTLPVAWFVHRWCGCPNSFESYWMKVKLNSAPREKSVVSPGALKPQVGNRIKSRRPHSSSLSSVPVLRVYDGRQTI